MNAQTETSLEDQILRIVASDPKGVTTHQVCKELDRTPQDMGEVFERLIRERRVFGFNGVWISPERYGEYCTRTTKALELLHSELPNLVLIAQEEIAARIEWQMGPKPLDRMLNRMALDGLLYKGADGVRLAAFRPVLASRHREFLDRVKEVLNSEPVSTPNPHQISRTLHVPSVAVDEILKLGIDTGEIVEPATGVFYTVEQLDQLGARLRQMDTGANLSASLVRDVFATTRKYSIALLSYFYPKAD